MKSDNPKDVLEEIFVCIDGNTSKHDSKESKVFSIGLWVESNTRGVLYKSTLLLGKPHDHLTTNKNIKEKSPNTKEASKNVKIRNQIVRDSLYNFVDTIDEIYELEYFSKWTKKVTILSINPDGIGEINHKFRALGRTDLRYSKDGKTEHIIKDPRERLKVLKVYKKVKSIIDMFFDTNTGTPGGARHIFWLYIFSKIIKKDILEGKCIIDIIKWLDKLKTTMENSDQSSRERWMSHFKDTATM